MLKLIVWLKGFGKKYGLGCFIVLFSSGLRFYAYNQSQYANGWDAYFYLVQIKSLLEEGAMHSSRISLFYPLLLLVKFLVQDYELSYKVVSALLAGLFSLSVFRFIRNATSNYVAIVIASFTWVSPQLTFFASQYPKNLMGLILLVELLTYLYKRKTLKTAIFFVAGVLTHKMTAGLSILAVGFQTFYRRIAVRHWKYYLLAVLGLLSVLLFFPRILSLYDFLRDGFGLTTKPGWPSMLFIKTHENLMFPLWKTEIVAGNVLFVISLIFGILRYKRTDKIWLTLLSILCVLTLPFFEWSLFGISYRFVAVFILLAPLSLGSLIRKMDKWIALSIALIFMMLSLFAIKRFDTKKVDPPYSLYQYIGDQIVKSDIDVELLIGHKAMAEYITFHTGMDVLPWLPEYPVEKERLWRIATGISVKEISYFAGTENADGRVIEITPNYFLIREDVWQTALGRIREEDPSLYDDLLTWKNPHEERPLYLRKR